MHVFVRVTVQLGEAEKRQEGKIKKGLFKWGAEEGGFYLFACLFFWEGGCRVLESPSHAVG